MAESTFQFHPSPTDIRRWGADRSVGIRGHLDRRFVDNGVPYSYFAGHDRALGLFPACEEPLLNEKGVEPRSFRLSRQGNYLKSSKIK